MTPDDGPCRVGGLWHYPVKSCRGIPLDSARFDAEGIEHDREWQLIDPDGRFVTQRELSRLACIVPALDDDCLTLTAPQLDPDATRITIALDDPGGQLLPVSCWSWHGQAIDQGETVADWLSALFGRPLRLVRFAPGQRRLCSPEWAGASGAHTRFSDGYPVLVLSQASVDDLASRLVAAGQMPATQTLSIERFRPNLVLHGVPAYDEDYVDTMNAGDLQLRLVKPCPRCVIPSIDPINGMVTAISPLATLSQYRLNSAVNGAIFGVNAIVERGFGHRLLVGQALEFAYRFD